MIEKQAGLISLAFPAINEHYDCKSQNEVVDAINDFIGGEPYELMKARQSLKITNNKMQIVVSSRYIELTLKCVLCPVTVNFPYLTKSYRTMVLYAFSKEVSRNA